MTDSMTGRDRERLADFLIMLKLWGCWSDPDEAQFIDSVLAKIKTIFGDWKTSSFEKFYVDGWSISKIAVADRKTRFKVAAEISEIESLLFFACKK